MTTTSGFPSRTVADAKIHLADVMRDAIHSSTPQIIMHGRRRRERVVVANPEQIALALAAYRFEPEFVSGDDEQVVRLARFGILGAGPTFEEALQDAVLRLREYAQEYFRDWALYSHTNRKSELPWLLRFSLTPEDQQSDLLTEPPLSAQSANFQQVAALTV